MDDGSGYYNSSEDYQPPPPSVGVRKHRNPAPPPPTNGHTRATNPFPSHLPPPMSMPMQSLPLPPAPEMTTAPVSSMGLMSLPLPPPPPPSQWNDAPPPMLPDAPLPPPPPLAEEEEEAAAAAATETEEGEQISALPMPPWSTMSTTTTTTNSNAVVDEGFNLARTASRSRQSSAASMAASTSSATEKGTYSTLPNPASSSREEASSWLDNLSTKLKDTSVGGTVRSMRDFSEPLEQRSTLKSSTGTIRHVKHNTLSGKITGLGLRGTVLNLRKSPFDDFPEVSFKEFMLPNTELLKQQRRDYDKLLERLLADRATLIADREQMLRQQQERDERFMATYQERINKRGTAKMKDFQKKHQHMLKERKAAKDPMSAKESKRISEEFEAQLLKELEAEQVSLESRLVNQRLKWIMPWFHQMKAMEILQYTRLHQFETSSLEEAQALERKQMEEAQDTMSRLDKKGFNKELKDTMKSRKTEKKPMAKEEIAWEQEVFDRNQQERFEEHSRQLEETHELQRQRLDEAQAEQIKIVELHYLRLENLLIGLKK